MYLYILLLFLLVSFYFWLTSNYNYWKKRNIPHVKPKLFFGSYTDYALMRKNLGLVDVDLCKKFPNEPLIGTYFGRAPGLIVKDPELIKLITTKDFYYFNGRELSQFTDKEVVLKNLFSESGDYWKVVRQNLTPLFSSAKLKKLFQLIESCNKILEDLLDEETRINDKLEVKGFLARYTMDCVGSCSFGINTDAMGKDIKNNPFRKIADDISDYSFERNLRFVCRNLWPSVFYGLGFKVFPLRIAEFFKNLLLEVFTQRNYQPSNKNDFADLVLSFKQKSHIFGDGIDNLKTQNERRKISLKVDDDLLVAQCLAFFAGGFDTTAATLSFTLYEFAKNQETQNIAREEVDKYLSEHDGKLEYECITELPYLEACTYEALRLYPVLGSLTRQVMEDYQLPTGLVVEKWTRIHFPLYYLQRHPDYFPEPEQYRPERFLPGQKENIIPNTFMPFGDGPRTCIGMRFGKMVMLSCLVTILKKYRIELAEGMPETLELEPKYEGSMAKSGINLKFLPRDL